MKDQTMDSVSNPSSNHAAASSEDILTPQPGDIVHFWGRGGPDDWQTGQIGTADLQEHELRLHSGIVQHVRADDNTVLIRQIGSGQHRRLRLQDVEMDRGIATASGHEKACLTRLTQKMLESAQRHHREMKRLHAGVEALSKRIPRSRPTEPDRDVSR